MTSFRNRLLIGVEWGSNDLEFFSHSQTLLASGYVRTVIGKRGPYVEFLSENIKWDKFHIPPSESYRQYDKRVFYDEYRSLDESNVKLYFQKRTVAYADYKIGRCYISPFDLLRTDFQPVIL